MFKEINQLSSNDAEKYGSKASILGELMFNGIRVPNGFAISNEVFIKYMEYNNIEFTIDDCLSRNEKICSEIINGEFPEFLEQKLKEVFDKSQLGNRYIVRSSALCEDNMVSSMAGMFSSFINLSSFHEVITCIKKCYASAFSDKIIAYISDNGFDVNSLKMGVIIQEFIVGDYSGVNFSADTIYMDEDVMHINVVNGFCDEFVSGKTKSSLFSIRKKDGSIIEENIQDEHKIFSQKHIKNLFEITMSIEKLIKEKVDIEWTMKDDEIYILQTRPITTFRENNFVVNWSNSDDKRYTWYCENDKPLFKLIADIDKRELCALNKGAYSVGDKFAYIDVIVQNGYSYYRNKEMNDHENQRNIFKYEVNELVKAGKNIFQDKFLPELIKLTNELDLYIKDKSVPTKISEFLKKSLDYMEFTSENHLKAAYACEYIKEFETYCKGIINDLSQQDLYDLVFNKSLLSKEREYYVLIASMINDNPNIKKMFDEIKYDEIIFNHLKLIPEAREILSLIDEYVKEYGISQLDCNLISTKIEPTILEKPSTILRYIRGFIGIDSNVYLESIKKSEKNKYFIKNLFLEKVGENQREEFLSKLKLAEKAYVARDNHHYYFERKSNAYLSLALNYASTILENNNNIPKNGDIYFLTVDEIIEGLIDNSNLFSVIKERKEEYEKQEKLIPPEYIGIEPTEEAESIFKDDNSTGCKNDDYIRLTGISGLKKKVKGKVHVGIPDFINEERILVIPYTRCGDVIPVLDKTIGIIVEQGSPFEHLGIILRELNIPCIYNVKDACTLLSNGDEVEIDGLKGEVVYKK
ncbi:PEP/pyruvate-binding domain-containing protein [Clostridium ihumii]|uniref:PEP/pyruvate-binding domain-containing protein n=1 Tax=Clostridium ihumii TaxID=1470356 RepID=UPI003D354C45